MNLPKHVTTFLSILVLSLSACNQGQKPIDQYAGFTGTDRIVEAVILQGGLYNVKDSLAKVYVTNENHKARLGASQVKLSHLLEKHYFNIADSGFLFAQNNKPIKASISRAFRKKLNSDIQPPPVKISGDDEPPVYTVIGIPILSKDGTTAFLSVTNYCGHCMDTTPYF